ncbi:MAG: hypothetical protein ACXV3V_04760, partial [Actinomycetes bacterium]
LLNDRTAWNKLWRRDFWTAHGFRWPEGVLYEDIPVTLPAHVLARSVDVIRQPVYLWRAREGDSTSITQRRTELRAIRDRHSAIDGVSRFLAAQGQHDLKQRYDRSCAEQDLRYFLQALDEADDEFRALFLDLANDFFDRARPDVFDDLPALGRLKWHLVRRRLMPELLEVLRFEKSGEITWTPTIRRGRQFYGDYPFRGDAALAIPESIYRLDRDELPLRARVDDVWWDGDTLRLAGYAHIAFLDLSKKGSARIRLTLEEAGHPESVVAFSVHPVRRPDVTEDAPDATTCYDWSGFDAALPVAALRHQGHFRDGQWRLRVEVRTQGITRRQWLSATRDGRAKHPPVLEVDGARVVPTTRSGDFGLEISTMPAQVDDVRVDGSVLELYGVLHGRNLDPADSEIRVARADGSTTRHAPVAPGGPRTAEDTPFVTRLALADLPNRVEVSDAVSGAEDQGDGMVWELSLLPGADGGRVPLTSSVTLPEPRVTIGSNEVALRTTRTGQIQLIERHFRPEIESVRWAADGSLELEGSYHAPEEQAAELILRHAERDVQHTVPMSRDGWRFRVRLCPAEMAGHDGKDPLAAGQWDMYARAEGNPAVRAKVDHQLLAELPSTITSHGRRLTALDVDYDNVALLVTDGAGP